MAEPHEESQDESKNDGDPQETVQNGAESQPVDDSENASPESDVARQDPPDSVDDGDELPEEEELTPEIVEEEAIRGDFMLRWAAIFLTVLFGFTQITDSRVLVHIRSGDQMRSDGFLPSGTDQLSYATGDDSVANVSWLFDHVVSLVHGMGGDTGLTIFKAFVAGIIAYLISLISVSGMPTWWSSICCGLVAAACSIDFMPVTDLATLVGMAIVLLTLHKQTEGVATGIQWKLPLTLAIWANFDPRAYLGVFAILLFALGTHFQRSRSQSNGEGPGPDPSPLWKATVFSFLALLVNPAPLASLTSVLSTYTVEHATMSKIRPLTDSNGATLPSNLLLDGRTEYFSLINVDLWSGFEFAYVAAVTLLAFAVIVFLLNRRRDDLPWLFLFLGFTTLAVIAAHELPVAAMVAAAGAGTSAQRWYKRAFRQEYTTNSSEVLFSRGGRAVTVFAFAAFAFFAASDHLPTRAPVGIGFVADLKTTMDSIGEQFAALPDDANVFNTVMEQGDLLIWHGRKSFIDSRASMFGRPSDETSAIHRFDTLRWSMVSNPPPKTPEGTTEQSAADQPESKRPYDAEWKQRFIDLGVTHTALRLSPPGRPAYGMAATLSRSPHWVLTHRGPSSMFFALISDPRKPPKQLLTQTLAFRRSTEIEDIQQLEFARPKDFYQKYVYASRITVDAASRSAQHFLNMDCQTPDQAIFQVASEAAQMPGPEGEIRRQFLGGTLGGPLMAIRYANEALLANPQNEMAHRILGNAYIRLNSAERTIASAMGGGDLSSMRSLQAVMALRQVVTINPDDAMSWEQLVSLYQTRGRIELADECLVRVLELREEELLNDPDAEDQLRQMYELQRTWREQRDNIQVQVDAALEKEKPEDPQEQGEQLFGLVEELYGQGFLRIALTIIKDNQEVLRQVPSAQVVHGSILLEVGELDEGFRILNQLAAVIAENPQHEGFVGVKWHNAVALSRLAKADYAGASDAWSEQLKLFTMFDKAPELSRGLMRALPFVAAVESQIGGFARWPLMNLQAASVPLNSASSGRYEPTLLRAIANLEAGNLANAKFILEQLIGEGGDHSMRPLASLYYRQLSDDANADVQDTSVDPWESFTFPGNADTSESATGEAKNEEPADGDSSSTDDSSTDSNPDSDSEDSASESGDADNQNPDEKETQSEDDAAPEAADSDE